MARVAPIPPAENDLLCENCGYTLNGLPENANCPECGKPVVESIAPQLRQPSPWDSRRGSSQFFQTTVEVLFRPKKFFRNLITRHSTANAKSFARIHWLAASILFALTAMQHLEWYRRNFSIGSDYNALLLFGFTVLIYLSLLWLTKLASTLTAWEAAYRGYRMPQQVVLRGLYFHAAHYLPVAAMACLTVFGYAFLLQRAILDATTATAYLYTLCAEVVIAAFYLFETYWIGMRSIMYANR